jgi:hydrogenase maturation protease
MIVAVGNALRGDDAAGLEVVEAISELLGRTHDQPGLDCASHDGEALELLGIWRDAASVVLVDTVRSGAPVGTIHRVDASAEPLPLTVQRTSSHAIGIGETIELARTLGALPEAVIVYGVEGARFGAGEELSPDVATAIGPLADAVLREARSMLARLPT